MLNRRRAPNKTLENWARQDSFLVWMSKELKNVTIKICYLLVVAYHVWCCALSFVFCVCTLYRIVLYRTLVHGGFGFFFRIVSTFGAWWFCVLCFFMFFYPYDIRLSCSTHGPYQNLRWVCLSHSSQLCPLGMLSNRWLVNSLGCYPVGLKFIRYISSSVQKSRGRGVKYSGLY